MSQLLCLAKLISLFPFAFDRKEEKKHGEGGNIVGVLKGKKVLVIDDVLTAGTALKESIGFIEAEGGDLSACVVALDREERVDGSIARDVIKEEHGIEIFSLARISTLVDYLDSLGKEHDAEIIRNHISNF